MTVARRDPAAAAARIRLWLKAYPDCVNIGSEIASSSEFVGPDWPYRLYAIDKEDLEAVLEAAERNLKGEG